MARGSLAAAARTPGVAVSAVTGEGMGELRQALARLCRSLPTPSPEARVRLWVDRAFTVRGTGTVVTGTLTGFPAPSVPVRVRVTPGMPLPASSTTRPSGR